MSLTGHIKLPSRTVQLHVRQHADGVWELYDFDWSRTRYKSFGLYPAKECNEFKAELELRMKMAEVLSAK